MSQLQRPLVTPISKDTKANWDFVNSHKGTGCMCVLDQKVFPFDPRGREELIDISNKELNTYLYDFKPIIQADNLRRAGRLDEDQEAKLFDQAMTGNYKEMLKDANRLYNRAMGASGDSGWKHLTGLGAAGGDQTYETAYETARRINYLRFEARASWFLAAFQARNMCNTETVSNFTWDGFTQPALLEGTPHIGDDVKPMVSRAEFEQFNIQLFADSFRYELSIREKTDSYMNLMEAYQRQVPGVMERMVNDRIIARLDALPFGQGGDLATGNTGDPSTPGAFGDYDLPDWDTRAPQLSHFVNDAAEHLEDAATAMEHYDGPVHCLIPRQGIRAYNTNKQGLLATPPQSSSPAERRKGQFEKNTDIDFYIDNHLRPNTLVIARVNHFLKFLQGPQLEFAYRDELTAGNAEGRVKFHFNNLGEMLDEAYTKFGGYI